MDVVRNRNMRVQLALKTKNRRDLLAGEFNNCGASVGGPIVDQDGVRLIDPSGREDDVGHEACALVVRFRGENRSACGQNSRRSLVVQQKQPCRVSSDSGIARPSAIAMIDFNPTGLSFVRRRSSANPPLVADRMLASLQSLQSLHTVQKGQRGDIHQIVIGPCQQRIDILNPG